MWIRWSFGLNLRTYIAGSILWLRENDFDNITILFCCCDIGHISLVHKSWLVKVSVGQFFNIWFLFVVLGVMSESWKVARDPPPLPQLQKFEKKLKELRLLKGAKSATWLNFDLCFVEVKLVSKNKVEWHCETAMRYTGDIGQSQVGRRNGDLNWPFAQFWSWYK